MRLHGWLEPPVVGVGVLVAAAGFGFRGVFALALVPVLLVPFAGRRVSEPSRYRAADAAIAVFAPAAAVAVLFCVVPETKDRELEEWAAG